MTHSDSEDASSDDERDTAIAGGVLDDGLSTGVLFSSTSFDHYFAQASKPSRTSANVFTSQMHPLSSHEYTTAISNWLDRPAPVPTPTVSYQSTFPHYLAQLSQGFNLLFYGAGSKRRTLNSLATHIHNSKAAHVIVINGTAPNLDYKDVLSTIERIPEVSSFPTTLRGMDGQMARISGFFSSDSPELYLVIHNIDAPPFRPLKAAALLSWLCAQSAIHVIASVDNVAFPVKASFDGQKPRHSGAISQKRAARAWLWHDATTLQSYDFELSSADRSSLNGASHGSSSNSHMRTDATNSNALLTPEAARHILVSVTQKAKKLFALLASRQLQSMEDSDASAKDPKRIGMEYSTLFSMARENFVATNDTSLRALMSEFRDHGLMLSLQSGGTGELVWIPLRKKALSDVIAAIEQAEL